MDFIAPCGANKSIFWPPNRTKFLCDTGKNFYSCDCYPRKISFFSLVAQYIFSTSGPNKSTFWPASRKKIVCNTGKTFILLVWLLPSLCSGIKLHTRKINFFFPSCTMHYGVQMGGKSRIACLCVERHAVNCALASKSGEMFIPPASKGENVHTARNLTARD